MADGALAAVRRGSLPQLQTAVSAPMQDLNRTDREGCSALHHAVWRNDLHNLQLLLEQGANVEQRDAESGWTALHRALYFGHLQAAALLLQRGHSASSPIADFQERTALDLLSGDLSAYTRPRSGEAFAWGHGANYQLGTGALGFQSMPVRLEELHGQQITAVAASKFHSAALTACGRLYTWGFGRGGRLGHPEFDIHSGKSAVISPRPVDAFSRVRVRAVAVSKHHSAAVLHTGELYTWGSNRDGRLGYTAVDSQPTPRRVGSLKGVPVACVAAANRHTVIATSDGRVFSWGSNLQAQLGYGTSDSASNAAPRVVEVLKGRDVTAVSAAKRHTLVLTSAGEVLTWGHRSVTPRRVQLAGVRDVARAPAASAEQATVTPAAGTQASDAEAAGGEWQVVFHRDKHHVAWPVAVAIAAGAAHSCVVTTAGTVLAWRSMDPNLHAAEVGGALAGKAVAYVDAGKYRTAAVTRKGDIYMWEGWSKAAEVPSSAERAASHTPAKQRLSKASSGGTALAATPDKQDSEQGKAAALADQGICPVRVDGVKQVAAVAVGEKHSLALQCWRTAPAISLFDAASPSNSAPLSPSADQQLTSPRTASTISPVQQLEDQEWNAAADGLSEAGEASGLSVQHSGLVTRASSGKTVPSLQRLCEATLAQHLVEPRTALQLLEFAEAAGASALSQHCLEVAVANLDVVLMEAHGVLEALPESVLRMLEHALQERCGPRPTAWTPAPGAAGSVAVPGVKTGAVARSPNALAALSQRLSGESSFAEGRETPEAAAMARLVRTLHKKLQQIEVLQQRLANVTEAGLDPQQQAKVATRPALQHALDASSSGASVEEVQRLMTAALAPLLEAHRARSSTPPDAKTRVGSSDHRGEAAASSAKENTPLQPADDVVDTWGGSARMGCSSRSAAAGPMPTSAADAVRQRSWADMAGSWRPPERLGGTGEASAGGGGSAKKAPRKGGLSLFLSGELERPTQPAPPAAPQAVPTALPAWKSSIPTASLRHIQSMEAAAASVRSRQEASASDAEASDPPSGVPLSQYMRKSAPIPMAPKAKSPAAAASAAEARPAWGHAAPGSSPPGVTFKDIQAQQEQHRESLSRSWGAAGASPNSRSGFTAAKSPPWQAGAAGSGLSGTSPGHAFPISGSSPGAGMRRTQGFTPAAQPQSKWYIQEQQAVAPLSSIQTEETALKEQSQASASMQLDKDADVLFTIDEAELPHGPKRNTAKEGSERKKAARRRRKPAQDAQSAPLSHDAGHAQPAHVEAASSDAPPLQPRQRHRRRHPKRAESAPDGQLGGAAVGADLQHSEAPAGPDVAARRPRHRRRSGEARSGQQAQQCAAADSERPASHQRTEQSRQNAGPRARRRTGPDTAAGYVASDGAPAQAVQPHVMHVGPAPS